MRNWTFSIFQLKIPTFQSSVVSIPPTVLCMQLCSTVAVSAVLTSFWLVKIGPQKLEFRTQIFSWSTSPKYLKVRRKV